MPPIVLYPKIQKGASGQEDEIHEVRIARVQSQSLGFWETLYPIFLLSPAEADVGQRIIEPTKYRTSVIINRTPVLYQISGHQFKIAMPSKTILLHLKFDDLVVIRYALLLLACRMTYWGSSQPQWNIFFLNSDLRKKEKKERNILLVNTVSKWAKSTTLFNSCKHFLKSFYREWKKSFFHFMFNQKGLAWLAMFWALFFFHFFTVTAIDWSKRFRVQKTGTFKKVVSVTIRHV